LNIHVHVSTRKNDEAIITKEHYMNAVTCCGLNITHIHVYIYTVQCVDISMYRYTYKVYMHTNNIIYEMYGSSTRQ